MKTDYREIFIRRLEKNHGWISQTRISYGNAFRQFFLHRSWMVLPMTAILTYIAALAIKDGFMQSMDGTMTGAFLLVGICIWNGSLSSVQAICRERAVVQMKNRLKLHLLSYVAGHVLFQFLVCVAETGIMLLMLWFAGIRYTGHPLFTGWFVLDFAITVFLILFASDLSALFLSALCRTKTAAMTILPFVLVLQLVFSGSVISIPDSIDPVAMITVSRPGFKAMAAQTDLNHLPISMVDSILTELEDTEINLKITIGQVLDLLSDQDNPAVVKARSTTIGAVTTVGELEEQLLHDKRFQGLRDTSIIGGLTIGDLMSEIAGSGLLDDYMDKQVGMELTLGEIVDLLANNSQLAGFRDEGISVDSSVEEVLELIGREKTQKMIEEKTALKYYNPDYEHNAKTVLSDWIRLLILILIFSAGCWIALESVSLWMKHRRVM